MVAEPHRALMRRKRRMADRLLMRIAALSKTAMTLWVEDMPVASELMQCGRGLAMALVAILIGLE